MSPPVLSPLAGNLTPLGVGKAAASSGGDGGIDSNCVALLRPVYSGGAWGIGDASPNGWTVTNSGMTIGNEGTGPWGGTSRAIYDPTASARAYATLTGMTRSLCRQIDFWVAPSPPKSIYSQVYLKFSTVTTQKPLVYFGQSGNSRRLFVSCYPNTGSTEYYLIPTDTWTDGTWVHGVIDLPITVPGVISLALNGVWKGSTPSHTPAIASTMYLDLGIYGLAVHDAYGESLAEVRLSSVQRWTPGTNFTPPAGPYS